MRAPGTKDRAAANAFRYADQKLCSLWGRLHRGDREPWPDVNFVMRCAAQNAAYAAWLESKGGPAAVAQGLRHAWREFHAGNFHRAIKLGDVLGALGSVPANQAAAVATRYARRTGPENLAILKAAVLRGEAAVDQLPNHAGGHFALALALGRYSQRISIVKAVALGLAVRVKDHLEQALQLEPAHAYAHAALGLYHAELIGKMGRLAAGLTYGGSRAEATEHFERALALAPASPIVRIEYANGLLLLSPTRNRLRAEALYAEAGALEPLDAMDDFDVAHARRGLD